MLNEFNNFIKKEKLFLKKEKILLCVSGGIDSVVMCELFKEAGFNFGIAHCNFQLRGDESDEDELFVEELAEELGVEFHCVAFDTSAFANKNKLSIQAAARKLRYDWFEEIREQFDYSFVATAHHRDDSIETFFINLIRGTGIAGLHGILVKQNKIIRPLLFAGKDELIAYAKKEKLDYREDSSNASDKYTRNKIRQKLIPLLKELNPDIQQTISKDIQRIVATEKIYRKEIESARKKAIKETNAGYSIDLKELMKLNPVETYLFEFLSPFGFNATQVSDMVAAWDGLSGKQFFSDSHRVVKDRDTLLVGSRESGARSEETGVGREVAGVGSRESEAFLIDEKQNKFENKDLELIFKVKTKTPDSSLLAPDSAVNIDFDKLNFPLIIRRWKQGDKFQPLGMKGKKKLSDLFVDKKLSLPEKENVWLLCSGNEIVWVIGLRMDDRFKVTSDTKKIYTVQQVFS